MGIVGPINVDPYDTASKMNEMKQSNVKVQSVFLNIIFFPMLFHSDS